MTVTYRETREVPLADLTPFPGNARRGDVKSIRASLQRLDQYRSLVVRDTGSGLVILAGNNTFEALQADGRATARCEIVECDDDEATRVNIVDNRLPDLGGYDKVALAEQLDWLDNDFTGIGFTANEVDELMRSVDFLGNQATQFLDDFSAPPPLPPASPAASPAPAPTQPTTPPPPAAGNREPAEQPAPAPASPPAGPVEQYVALSWTVTVSQRETIRAALRTAQARNNLATAAEALVAIAESYQENAS